VSNTKSLKKKIIKLIVWILFSIFTLSSYQNARWLDSHSFNSKTTEKISLLCLEKHGSEIEKVKACEQLLTIKESNKRETIYSVLFTTAFILIPILFFYSIYKKIKLRKKEKPI